MAAVFASGQRAVLSHRTAAAHWGILPTARAAVDVTVQGRGSRTRRRGIDVHLVRRLDPRDVTVHNGLPVTSVARTLVDLAPTGPARHVERALEQAYVQRLLAPRALEDALGRARGRRTAVLRALIKDKQRSTVTRSQLEEAFLAIVRGIGLPDPEVNEPLHGYEPDFLWREKRLVIEADGYGTHSTRRAFEHDRRRDVELALHGYSVHRFSHDQVVHAPHETGRLLRLLYDAR